MRLCLPAVQLEECVKSTDSTILLHVVALRTSSSLWSSATSEVICWWLWRRFVVSSGMKYLLEPHAMFFVAPASILQYAVLVASTSAAWKTRCASFRFFGESRPVSFPEVMSRWTVADVSGDPSMVRPSGECGPRQMPGPSW